MHDRKLCVLGLCALLSMGPQKPQAVNECASQFIPCFLLLFDGLKKAYAGNLVVYLYYLMLFVLVSFNFYVTYLDAYLLSSTY